MFCVRFTPAVCRIAPNRTACDILRSYSAVGRDRHSCVLAALVRLSTLAGSLRVCSFICGDPDGGRGERGWRRSVSALLRNHIGFAMFSAGSTLGLRAPNLRQRVKSGSGTAASLDSLHAAAGLPWCVFAALVRFCATASALLGFPRGIRWGYAPQTCAKESSTLWTLFTLRRGCLSAYTRRHPGTRKDPPESNLCSGGSGCIAMLPIRTIVQTRSAPKR